jgi:integrase
VREVESSDIVALIDDCKLTWGESSLLHVAAKCLFTHACGKRLINANPCVGIMISALLGPRPPVRKRLMLTREELHLLLNAPMRRPNALAIRILLSTGVRGSELFTAKWKDVHLAEAR